MYDAVHLFARALDKLDSEDKVVVSPSYCEGDSKWAHGKSLVYSMQKV